MLDYVKHQIMRNFNYGDVSVQLGRHVRYVGLFSIPYIASDNEVTKSWIETDHT
jgi:hypothetical protein